MGKPRSKSRFIHIKRQATDIRLAKGKMELKVSFNFSSFPYRMRILSDELKRAKGNQITD